MQTAERIRFLLFVALVAAIYVLAAGIVVRWVLQRFGLTTLSAKRSHVWSRRCVLAAAALGSVCVVYGRFVEPYWVEVTHVRIASAKLAAGTRPIRIVHLSDIHSDPTPRLEERLPGLIARERPDLIVFTGDSLNSPEGLQVFRNCLTKIAAIAPTFAVRGNWDVWFWSNIDLFGGTGARELQSEAIRIDVRGTPVWVAGVPVDSERQLGDVLEPIPAGEFNVFLHHYPDAILDVAKHPVDLYCAGHIHGGQIALPFYGALVTLSKFGKRFEAGLYRVGGTSLYVNRGIGMEGGAAPRVRFCARPEVTVIEVGPVPSSVRVVRPGDVSPRPPPLDRRGHDPP